MNKDQFIYQLNPAYKLVTHLLFMILMTVISDPLTSFLLMLIPLMLILTMIRLPLRSLLTYSIPFLMLFLLSTWSLAAFGKGETIWFKWAWFHFTEEGFFKGLTIGFRTLGFAFYGMLFLLTIDVTTFILSLMQQFRLPPKWAYALLAGFRFIPLFKDEFEQIRAAHRIRGVGRTHDIRSRIQGVFRFTIPLLTQGVRKAERVATAMESRSFDGSWNRTFFKTTSGSIWDISYFLLLFVIHFIVIFISMKLGYIRWGFL